uniref:Uncharacterized protein n=1 Tax=Setaria digitata TaxID=48799 RepID=A0A915Q142_9BILA
MGLRCYPAGDRDPVISPLGNPGHLSVTESAKQLQCAVARRHGSASIVCSLIEKTYSIMKMQDGSATWVHRAECSGIDCAECKERGASEMWYCNWGEAGRHCEQDG